MNPVIVQYFVLAVQKLWVWPSHTPKGGRQLRACIPLTPIHFPSDPPKKKLHSCFLLTFWVDIASWGMSQPRGVNRRISEDWPEKISSEIFDCRMVYQNLLEKKNSSEIFELRRTERSEIREPEELIRVLRSTKCRSPQERQHFSLILLTQN